MAELLAPDPTATATGGAQAACAATRGATTPHRAAAPARRLPAWTGIKGFVDVHCHLLPGLDDGPANEDASLRLAAAAYAGGTAAIVATPHNSFRFPFRHDDAQRELRRIERHVPEDLALFTGCELEISDESLRAFFAAPAHFTLNQGRYVLIELKGQSCPPNFDQVLLQFRERGFQPILAHPERYPPVHTQPRRLYEWRERGCLFQITSASLTGRMGRRAWSAACAMLREGLADFVASDAHDDAKRPPQLLEGFRIASQIAGITAAGRLFTYNPLAVLHDEPLR
jgi:protein-tyrosine phosphatase